MSMSVDTATPAFTVPDVAAYGGVYVPMSRELLADGPAWSGYLRAAYRWFEAEFTGNLVYRGGGWYRLHGETLRGKRAVWAALRVD